MERNTSQKQVILDYVRGVNTHPTAEEIFSAIKERLPNVSRATVYRVLQQFKRRGEIKELPTHVRRYDGDLSKHYHFICNECNGVFDVFNSVEEMRVNDKVDLGRVKVYEVYFYGECKSCNAKHT